MTAPKHLWSGDWRRESAAAADERADRRGPTDAPAEPPPAEPRRAKTPAAERPAAGPQRGRTPAANAQAVQPRVAAPRPAQPRAAKPRPAQPRAAKPRPARASRPLHDLLARLAATVRRARPPRVRTAVLIAIATVLSAVAAYALVSALVSPESQNPAQPPSQGQQASTSSTGSPWLGVETTSSPVGGGAIVISVAPGSPANAAGLLPGDVITGIDNHSVQSPADVQSALTGLPAGQQVQISYNRGPISLTTEATLTTRPAGP